jgi:hypothetical protein
MEKAYTITNTFKSMSKVTVREHGKPPVDILVKRLLELSYRTNIDTDQKRGA